MSNDMTSSVPPVLSSGGPPPIPPPIPARTGWHRLRAVLNRSRTTVAMQWRDLLFAHWSLPAEVLAPLLPKTSPGLELDTFEGRAWLGIVPFSMRGIHLRGWPAIPGATAFPELNIRTYVVANGRPGVWFFSLDAAHRVAVRVGRKVFHLPYFDADMTVAPAGNGVAYASWRTHRGGGTAELVARYEPVGPVFQSVPGSLDDWLTARFRLFTADRSGRLKRCEVEHAPWPLQRARAEFQSLDMSRCLGVDLPDEPPHLLFARRLDVRASLLLPA